MTPSNWKPQLLFSHLAGRFVATSSPFSGSVRLYLSALRFFQVKLFTVDPSLPGMAQLHYTLHGLS